MGLKDQIKKEEDELKKLEGDEGADDDNDGDEGADDNDEGDSDDDNDGDEGADDDKAAKNKKTPAKKDDKADKKGKKADDADEDDDSDDEDDADPKKKNDSAAKLRLERKKRMKLEEELAALRKQPAQQPPAQQKPAAQDQGKPKVETTEEKVARLETQDRQRQENDARTALQTQAIEEFNSIEEEFAKETPDYEDASAHMIKSMFQGVKAAYPGVTDKQALGFVHNRVLQLASQAAKKGLNPAEYLYQMSFDTYGFDPTKIRKETKQKNGNNKVDNLKNIAKNKQRSASPIAGAGQNAGARATIDEAAKMDLATFGNMSESEIDSLIADAND